MSQSPTVLPGVSPRHPILACADRVGTELDAVADIEPAFMRTSEKADALRELALRETQLAALRLRVMAAAGDVATSSGHRDLASWLREETRAEPRVAHAEMRLAQTLEEHHAHLAKRLRDGAVTVDQARVIAHALDDLSGDATATDRVKAEALLVEHAAQHTPPELRRLGRHILEVVDPTRFEQAEARALEREEREAQKRVSCAFRDHRDGTVAVNLTLPLADAARLKTYLEAYAQPRKQALADRGKKVPYDRLLGQAFQHLLNHLDPAKLPHHGGDATTVIVTIPLETLQSQLGAAALGYDGERITAEHARRLACQAHLIPAVLGTHGELLDLGRAARLFTPAQRKAIRHRDQHCRAEHCRTPATWCDVHHLRPWSSGGTTDRADGVLLCGHHHRQAHRPEFDLRQLPNGDLRFHRRE